MSRNGQTYAEKLRRPEWQRKRLEILERDGFKCTDCGDKESELHVHHLYYRKGRNPWEYEGDAYRTLCARCHETHEVMARAILASLGAFSWGEVHAIGRILYALADRDEFQRRRLANIVCETEEGGRVAVDGMLFAIGVLCDGLSSEIGYRGEE